MTYEQAVVKLIRRGWHVQVGDNEKEDRWGAPATPDLKVFSFEKACELEGLDIQA